MPLPERSQVIDMVDYLRETLTKLDAASVWLEAQRHEFAVRLAAMEAATNPAVLEASDDFEYRAAQDRPYETAEPAVELLSEAHRRYCSS